MNRREVLKLSGGAVCGLAQAAIASGIGAGSPAAAESSGDRVERWGVFEASFQGPAEGNPFLDVQLRAIFQFQNRTVPVSGFYDGAGVYRVRFMPDEPGEWSFRTESNSAALNGKTGRLQVTAPSARNHGPVGVNYGRHFAYADGTPYAPFGTTCYAWAHQGDELEEETLKTLSAAPFNKMRMCIFPKSYDYNHNEPPLYPFPRDAAGANDTSTFNVKFFEHLEQRIQDLNRLGIEADLILFHPYDRWGYASLPPEVNDRYLRYVIARFAACRNVWWSLANEYDFVKSKSASDWDRFARLIQEEDPYHHLRSIHYGHVVYDYSRAWATHACVQSYDFAKARQWLDEWNKPIIYDECQYEGNLPNRWGNLSAEEMTRRFWMAIVVGCYAGHGETYLDPKDVIWWSKGGVLHGGSPARIGFLRRLVEESAPGGFQAAEDAYSLCTTAGGNVLLYYFDYHQPGEYQFKLPAGSSYRAELIDPWEMTTSPVEGAQQGSVKLKLTGKPYQAVRFRRNN
ncbi:MAG TPA: DUF5060 domain-containing protein [Acidobacteriaceae bacterium]|nr:DUF5060 domain-containing protein [Acidobacteriaceae bacterium]